MDMDSYNMKNMSKKYLTVNELSQLFNISRQTILLYDKHNLLKPKFRDILNNYRYYHFKEYTKLELIYNLRKIGLSMNKIQQYMNNKSEGSLMQILDEQTAKCQQLIKETQSLIADMQRLKLQLNTTTDKNYDTFTINSINERRYYISNLSTKRTQLKKRMLVFGNSNLNFYKTNHLKYFFDSFIIKKADYLNGLYNTNRYYCFPADENIEKLPILVMPSGKYLSYTFHGLYQPKSQQLWQEVTNFCQYHDLQIVTDIMITAQKNFWVTNNTNEYINTLTVGVL